MRKASERSLRRYAAFSLSAALLFSPAPSVGAAVFNPHFIISDEEVRNADGMTFEEIRQFLTKKGGFGASFDADAIDGLLKNAAQLIYDAAMRYRVNPKYILALIQKESGAVEAAIPTPRQLEWATGYGLCDGCSRSSALAEKNRGLGKQIDAGAGWMHWYLTNAANLTYLKQPGVTFVSAGISVTPANYATAALYSYTPNVAGNKLLWSIWNRWFGGGLAGLQFPDGTLVRSQKTNAVALVQGGKFRPILNASVLESRFNTRTIIDVSDGDFAALQESNPGRPVKFSDLSLVRTEDGSLYLLIGNTRRRIETPEVFAKIGFNPEEVEDVAADDIAEYREGVPIALGAAYPIGQLVQNNATGGVYYAEAGVKQPIWDRAILDARFPGKKIIPLTPEELENMPTGDPVNFPDGTLVKVPDDPSVFVIAGGKKRLIPTEDVFLAFGYRWTTILTTNPKALELHEAGEPLLLVNDKVTAATVGL